MQGCPGQGGSDHRTYLGPASPCYGVYNPLHGHRELWVDLNLRGKPTGQWTPVSKIGTGADHTSPSPPVILGDDETLLGG